MGMASHIKRGETIFIPFRNGQSISDSQLRPRMYKSMNAFEKSFPGHYLGNTDLEIAEYVEVVRCKDCKHMNVVGVGYRWCKAWERIQTMGDDGFCCFGERKDND